MDTLHPLVLRLLEIAQIETEPLAIHLTFQKDHAMQKHLGIFVDGLIKGLSKELDRKAQTTHGTESCGYVL